MIVLDTNVVSELMHPKGSLVVRQWVAAQPITNLFTTTITEAEILYGIALLPSGKRQTAQRNFERALSIDPDEVEANYRSYVTFGRAKAVKNWQSDPNLSQTAQNCGTDLPHLPKTCHRGYRSGFHPVLPSSPCHRLLE